MPIAMIARRFDIFYIKTRRPLKTGQSGGLNLRLYGAPFFGVIR